MKRWQEVKLIGGIYVRASRDSSGRAISIGTQMDEGVEFFEEFDVEHAATYSDNNLSGSPYATEARGDYERALEDLRAGRINLLWTFDHSRAQRDIEVYAKLRRICEETGAFWAYAGRIYDMTDPKDRKDSARDAVDAENAADNISIHSRRGKRGRRKRGEHNGPTAYGYKPVYSPDTGRSLGWVIVEEEAAIIRRIVADGLDGKGPTTIARELNAEGIPTSRGHLWDKRRVQHVSDEHRTREWPKFVASLSPDQLDVAHEIIKRVNDGETPKEIARDLNRRGVAYFFPSQWNETKVKNIGLALPTAGLLAHDGGVYMEKKPDPDAPEGYRMVPVETKWEPIKSVADHDALVALWEPRKTNTNRDGERVRHLWTGITKCAVCGKGLSSRVNHGKRRLECLNGKGCVSRDQTLTEAWLTEHALQLLEREDAAQLFRLDVAANDASRAQQEAERLRTQLEGFRAQALAEKITPESFAVFEAALLPKIQKAEQLARRAKLPPVLAEVIGPDARSAFLSLDLVQKRKILRAIMRPKVHKTNRKVKGRLDTSTIDPGLLFGEPNMLPPVAAPFFPAA
ncbi:recombinase family protein [Actinosynnema sp. CA-248983]